MLSIAFGKGRGGRDDDDDEDDREEQDSSYGDGEGKEAPPSVSATPVFFAVMFMCTFYFDCLLLSSSIT